SGKSSTTLMSSVNEASMIAFSTVGSVQVIRPASIDSRPRKIPTARNTMPWSLLPPPPPHPASTSTAAAVAKAVAPRATLDPNPSIPFIPSPHSGVRRLVRPRSRVADQRPNRAEPLGSSLRPLEPTDHLVGDLLGRRGGGVDSLPDLRVHRCALGEQGPHPVRHRGRAGEERTVRRIRPDPLRDRLG